MAKFTIREGRREDCQEIRRLIQELADFEKMPDGPKISAEDLMKDGFDTQPPLFYTYVAESEDKPGVLMGYILYYWIYGSCTGKRMYIEDIYITESLRGSGVGKEMIQKVTEKAVKTDCRDTHFVVLDWNPAREFYFKLGATDISEGEGWRLFRINRPEMNKFLSEK